jgi:hypothetical protein
MSTALRGPQYFVLRYAGIISNNVQVALPYDWDSGNAQTPYRSNTADPVWGEYATSCKTGLSVSMGGVITLRAWDYDTTSGDDDQGHLDITVDGVSTSSTTASLDMTGAATSNTGATVTYSLTYS